MSTRLTEGRRLLQREPLRRRLVAARADEDDHGVLRRFGLCMCV